jgi:hypothetical protein
MRPGLFVDLQVWMGKAYKPPAAHATLVLLLSVHEGNPACLGVLELTLRSGKFATLKTHSTIEPDPGWVRDFLHHRNAFRLNE